MAELGAVETKRSKFGIVSIFTTALSLPLFMPVQYVIGIFFMKAAIPEALEEKVVFARKLSKYSISLLEYSRAMQQEEIRYNFIHCLM